MRHFSITLSATTSALCCFSLLACVFILSACSAGDDDAESAFIVDVPIVYIQRDTPTDDNNNLIFTDHADPLAFHPGAAVYIQQRATANVGAINISAGLFNGSRAYDVKDLAASHDGQTMLFSARAPEIPDADPDEQPTWNIWEYHLKDKTLRRIISSDILSSAGHDIMPQYLADGRIVFSSTRQRGINAIRLDEDKPQFSALSQGSQVQAALLHVMESDGSNIEQISYNSQHDLYPSLLNDGKIIFSRHQNNAINLFSSKPDGTETQLIYGSKSHATGSGSTPIQFVKAAQSLNGQLLVQATPFSPNYHGSNWYTVNYKDFINFDQAISSNMASNARTQIPLFKQSIPSENTLALSGRYLSVYELADGSDRYLVTWNACRLRDFTANNAVDLLCNDKNIANPSLSEGPANASLWVYDANNNSQKPIVIPAKGQMISEAIAIHEKQAPNFIQDQVNLENWGTLKIRSIYDIDGIDSRIDNNIVNWNTSDARFLRVTKNVGVPDRDTYNFPNSAFGGFNQMQQILGYTTIESDGSVAVKVPANIPFNISIVDANGRRLHRQRHNNVLQLRPGETLECHGCHDADSNNPHGRPDLEANSIITNPQTLAEIDLDAQGLKSLSPDLIRNAPEVIDISLTRLNDSNTDNEYYAKLPYKESCDLVWELRCRITINYEQHIQPLWDKDRAELDSNGQAVNHRCSNCHNQKDLAGSLQVPPGNLELTDQASDRQNDHFTSFRELLFNDNEQYIDTTTGLLADIDTDPETIDIQGINVPASLNRNGANFNASVAFFNRFEDGSNDIHFELLTDSERRLLSEWIDIGGQYYNNPFDAPEN